MAFIFALQSTISIAGYMEVGAKIDMLTHIYSSNKNVLDKKHHIEAASYTFCEKSMTTIYGDNKGRNVWLIPAFAPSPIAI